jgi:hypothetical protein
MLEAGVPFDFVEQIVTTYYVDSDSLALEWWREKLRARGRFSAGKVA